jgi:uncharacterized SAM-binding protein YcdF (DUF218 family)
MSISWLITNLIAGLLLPPVSLLILGLIGLAVLKRHRALGRGLIAISLIMIWLLSTPWIAGFLLNSLKPVPTALTGKEADAIVILAGGSIKDSTEYGGDTLGRFSLERVRYGAWLAKRLGKPILVTGGAPIGGKPEAEIMRDSLMLEFGVKRVRWVESDSINTRENARYAAHLLKPDGIQRIYLVTNAWHLARAIPEFEMLGFKVIPAGTGYSLPQPLVPLDFLPNGKALHDSWLALHEWLGLLWYRIRH